MLGAKLCECGCGLPAPIADDNDKTRGRVKGQPLRFRPHHYKPQPATDSERLTLFWSHVFKTETCWIWRASTNPKGYGTFYRGDRLVGAHRFAYEITYGAIPPGMEIDHLCRNRSCVNPTHLQVVTHEENLKRSPDTVTVKNMAKTHCERGHAFVPGNVYIYTHPNGRTSRQCRPCSRRRDAIRRRAKAC
jgi:hypothetical protein